MYLERLLFLITGVFVFLCLGFALIIMASNPAKRPSDQIAAPPAEVADARDPPPSNPSRPSRRRSTKTPPDKDWID